MDLDALGLNSTFESTDIETNHQPPVDRVDTSEIEGPEDFTMNMTYWMTADLPLAQIKSRKEAASRKLDIREDAIRDLEVAQETTGEGDKVLIEDMASVELSTRANGTTLDHERSTAATEASMENDEKVRSFLSALPDTDMGSALMGTPLRAPKNSFLQIPMSSPPKARSLQATVEDYDTPRKPTQETVIHHTLAVADDSTQNTFNDQFADIQAQLEQQSLASKTRIVELETILAYIRTELDNARTENYKHKSMLTALEQQQKEGAAARSSLETQLKTQEEALVSKMQEFGEEMRLQNQAKLQSQRTDFEQKLRTVEETRRAVEQTLEQVRGDNAAAAFTSGNSQDQDMRGHEDLTHKLASVQARADDLHAQLEKVTAEAKARREDIQAREKSRMNDEAKTHAQKIQIATLEGHLRTVRFELECAQADVAAKQQLFQSNIDLNSRLRTLQTELDTRTAINISKDQQNSQTNSDAHFLSMQSQLTSTQADLLSKDQQILGHIHAQEQVEQRLNTAQGRVEGLESTVTTLRQQLAEAHRDSARARTETERCQGELEDANDRLQDARAEADRRVADVEKKLNKMKESRADAERKLHDLQSHGEEQARDHETMLEDVRDRAEDAVRKVGTLLEQERREKKRLIKDLKRSQEELSSLREATTQNPADEESSDDSDTQTKISPSALQKDSEIATLRSTLRRRTSELKSLKANSLALEKQLSTRTSSAADYRATIAALQARLADQEDDFVAINRAMDEKLAVMLNKLVKERAKAVVGKRDGQWTELVEQLGREREVMGKVLLRQWGREEVGIANEKKGEKQGFVYKFVER